MELESRAGTVAVEPARPADKVRLRFRKEGPLRLLSHHDLMRTFERMLRRAALPFRSSQGFHPKPRIVFALSLPLGVIGLEEVAELELDEVLPISEIRERLTQQAPPGLQVLSVQRVNPRVQAQVRRLCYRLPVSTDQLDELQPRIAAVLGSTECWVERTRPPARRVDLRPFISDLRVVATTNEHRSLNPPSQHGHNGVLLEMELWLTPAGTARPEELLTVLGIQDLIDAGAILERSRLELHDEITTASAPTVSVEARRHTAMAAVENIRPQLETGVALLAAPQPNTSTEGNA